MNTIHCFPHPRKMVARQYSTCGTRAFLAQPPGACLAAYDALPGGEVGGDGLSDMGYVVIRLLLGRHIAYMLLVGFIDTLF